MKTIEINDTLDTAIYEFAKTDIDVLDAQGKVDYIISVARNLHMSPNAFLQTMKPLIKASKEKGETLHYDLAETLEASVYTVALFKARRCYHTMLKQRATKF